MNFQVILGDALRTYPRSVLADTPLSSVKMASSLTNDTNKAQQLRVGSEELSGLRLEGDRAQ